jgi:hypothetical protein
MSYTIKASNVELEQKPINRFNNVDVGSNFQPIQESSDISQTIQELNDDSLTDNFSAIDMKTRLLNIEISSIIAVDCLVGMGFLPKQAGFITRSKKRLAVSLNGRGREEIVNIAGGLRDNKAGTSFMDKFSGMFKRGD